MKDNLATLGQVKNVVDKLNSAINTNSEQITKNKEDIAGLSAQIYNMDIVEESSGTQVIVDDSAEGIGRGRYRRTRGGNRK